MGVVTVNKVAEVSAQYLAELEENAVPVGYKQTEVGLIPEDWEESTINDVLSEISMGPFGSDIKVSNFVDCGVPVLSGLNVNAEKLKDQFTNYVTKEKAKALKKAVASRGDVVVTHRGTIGRISYIPEDSLFEKYVISQSQFRARFVSKVLPSWVVLYFHSSQGSRSLLEGKSHTGVPAIAQATTTFRKLKLSLPRIEEQTAIANALSDVDALISELEKLIAKKQAIKTATMQQLLTGRTRLPQFALREDGSKKGYKQSELGDIPEDWGVMTIGDALDSGFIFDQMDGNHGDLYPKSHEFSSYGVPYVGATDFYSGRIDYKNCKYLPEVRAKKFKKGIAVDGDVLFAHNATVGPVAILRTGLDFVILSTTATYYRCNSEKIKNVFLAKYFESEFFVKQYSAVMSQSTRNQVPILAQRKFFLILPEIEEQTAIATILSDMDSEIQALQQRLTKTRQIKQGMMQELLTGKTRLPFAADIEVDNV
ncbi:MAG TPA: restriction endonuclease subunit S [Gammaproteobacteria bacterium]|nr:restriction endonuclease subunit S [Gammaproteobacteria bacterium]